MRLEAHGIAVELPHHWSGRIFRRPGGNATLHAASFPLALNDGEFGDASTARMPPGAMFVALAEYLPGAGLTPGEGLFAPRRVRLPLDPAAFSARGLAHPRADQAGAQQFFTSAGRPLCLYVVLAGGPAHRRSQLPLLDGVLRTLRIAGAAPGAGGAPGAAGAAA